MRARAVRLVLRARRWQGDPLLRHAVASVAGKSITTLEGLPALYAQQKGLPRPPALHPLQQAFIDVQAMHCGYCYNGMTIKGSELLAQNPRPSDAEIRAHMNGHLCRCGTYPRVM